MLGAWAGDGRNSRTLTTTEAASPLARGPQPGREAGAERCGRRRSAGQGRPARPAAPRGLQPEPGGWARVWEDSACGQRDPRPKETSVCHGSSSPQDGKESEATHCPARLDGITGALVQGSGFVHYPWVDTGKFRIFGK